MSKKFSAARRSAFLRAVAETGNQALAAERAKVSQSWVTMTRARDPEFDAAVRAAVAAAREHLRSMPNAPLDSLGTSGGGGPGLAYHGGIELVVRGSNGRRAQIARARVRQWTPAVERRFLEGLAATCNVKAACAAVGLSPASAYNHRHRRDAFAAAWDEAVEEGYLRIEAVLIETACDSLTGVAFAADAPMPAMTIAEAFQLLHMHKHQVRDIGKRPGLTRRPRTLDDVRASIVRKLEMIERARDRGGQVRSRSSPRA